MAMWLPDNEKDLHPFRYQWNTEEWWLYTRRLLALKMDLSSRRVTTTQQLHSYRQVSRLRPVLHKDLPFRQQQSGGDLSISKPFSSLYGPGEVLCFWPFESLTTQYRGRLEKAPHRTWYGAMVTLGFQCEGRIMFLSIGFYTECFCIKHS